MLGAENVKTLSEDFPFSDESFQFIAAKVGSEFGIRLHRDKKELVHSRLTKRLRALNLSSFEEYCDILSRTSGDSESVHLLSSITTNVTHFYREPHHFEYLTEMMPKLIKKARRGEPIRLWSAGCSAGQEAYTISSVILSNFPDLLNLDLKILATDIDPKMIAAAKSGLYTCDDTNRLPTNLKNALFRKPFTDPLEISDAARKMITFGCLNLIAEWPMKGKFDVIFCRNVAIYFDKGTQSKLWNRFYNALNEDGVLMIGHSERLSGRAAQKFSSAGITTYRRSQ